MGRYELKPDELVQAALKLGAGAVDARLIPASEILVEDELAEMCREPRCSNYGLSKSCPPHVPGPAAMREWLRHYEHAVFIKIDVPADLLQTNELQDILKLLHKISAGVEKLALGLGYSRAKAFAGGSCKHIFCRDHAGCSVLEGGECRNPRYARPSMSGFGINVSKLKELAGWSEERDTANAGTDTSTSAFYGLVLVGKMEGAKHD